MSYTSFQKRIDRIITDMAIRKRGLSTNMSKQEHPEYKPSIVGALVSICELSEESAVSIADKITHLPICECDMNTGDILAFFKKEYGI